MTDWPVKTLGEVCDFVSGSVTPKSGVKYQVFSVPSFDSGNPELLDGSEIKSSKRPVKTGDVLLCKINPRINRVWRVDRESKNQQIASTEWIALRCRENVLDTFLQYVLQAPSARTAMIESVTGATGSHTRAKFEIVEELEFSVPPLEEQKRIVAMLDAVTVRVTELTACYEHARTHAGLLGGSILVNQLTGVIGSKTIKLGDLAELKGRIGWRGLTAKEYTKEGPLFVSVHSLNYGHFVNLKDAFHITQERYDESPEIMLEDHDILICKDGAGIGKLGIVGQLPGPATINSSLLLIRASERVRSEFLYFYLLSPIFQNLVQERLSGSTTPHLYQRDIAELEIELPSLETQDLLIERMWRALKKQDELIECFSKQIEAASQIRQSILESAFAGDL